MIELHVNAAYIKRLDNNIISSGQAGTVMLKCTFEEPGWANMVKYATFVIPGIRTVFKERLVDNKCKVPAEALAQAGPLIVGVYGTVMAKEALRTTEPWRYSPAVTTITLRQGSYFEAEEPSAVTISEWFAQQAADAKEAADKAIKAAKIANEILLSINKEVSNE